LWALKSFEKRGEPNADTFRRLVYETDHHSPGFLGFPIFSRFRNALSRWLSFRSNTIIIVRSTRTYAVLSTLSQNARVSSKKKIVFTLDFDSWTIQKNNDEFRNSCPGRVRKEFFFNFLRQSDRRQFSLLIVSSARHVPSRTTITFSAVFPVV